MPCACLPGVGRNQGFKAMTSLLMLIPIALLLGLAGLAAFLWSVRSGQFEDLHGADTRILYDQEAPLPARQPPR